MDKHFEFNDCGVCTNPNKYGVDWRNEIKTAQRPDGKWVVGFSYQFDTPDGEGGGRGARLRDSNVFDTEREAAMDGIRYMLHRASLRKFERGDKRRAGMDACIELVYNKFNQLTLF